MKTIVFVCTGNTCRSIMAQGIFEKLVKEQGLTGQFAIKSAGIGANEEDAISANAAKALEEIGIDKHSHHAHRLTMQDVAEADILVPMTPSHAAAIVSADPEAINKIILLPRPVPDPFMGSLEVYRACRDDLKEQLITLLEELCHER